MQQEQAFLNLTREAIVQAPNILYTTGNNRIFDSIVYSNFADKTCPKENDCYKPLAFKRYSNRNQLGIKLEKNTFTIKVYRL